MPFFNRVWWCLSLLCSASLSAEPAQNSPPVDTQPPPAVQRSVVDIPAHLEETVRKAMAGQGEFAMPGSNALLNKLTPAQRESLMQMAKQAKARQQALLESGTLSHFQSDYLTQQVKRHQQAAQMISTHSVSKLDRVLTEHAGMSEEQVRGFAANAEQAGAPQSRQDEPHEKAMFMSFSMPRAEIRHLIQVAAEAGAEVYLNGLHPEHTQINETMLMLRDLAKGIDNPPMIRFNPTAFKKYAVNSVPTILYREFDRHILAAGVTSLTWLEQEFRHQDQSVDYGVTGPISPVVERSIIEEMQARMARYDWQAARQRTIDSYWARQTMVSLPRAQHTESWMIDPTVSASKDIYTPRGKLVAAQGAVVNPLKGHSTGLTTVLFNAMDPRQVEFVTAQLETLDTVGQLMLITSQIDTSKGWAHMKVLTEHFGQQIYLMPQALASRFQLTALPAIVRTDLDRSMLHVTQFSLSSQE
ncbi:TrbC family F-type conjugative pilus assembly protein [Pseudoalteromonas rubra]|uniref:Conjugal transfer protein n=1 Tax=Pseudoalteromonas rubra TaxID=43658 RepID=A0A0U3HWZ6_9GAMM|nr:TrbC family F-type conjugative pilus assembly protein [Pseudoalteromonas rubra]ALU46121.1 hypothetical protein AT705_24475 [Pseudoalteromonas rubra]